MSRISLAIDAGLATVSMDDGKVNAIQGPWLDEMSAALDRCGADDVRAVVLVGRPGVFSAGLDLKALPLLPAAELKRVLAQFGAVMQRLFLFPKPLVVACTGHALAGGCITLLCGDRRIGANGPLKIGLNEVAIGLPLPGFVVGMARSALTPPALQRAVVEGGVFDGVGALAAGYLHEIVEPEQVLLRATEVARQLGALAAGPYAKTKARVRSTAVFDDALYEEEIAAFIVGRG